MADSMTATAAAVDVTDDGLDLLDGVPAALYIWGEIHKVWDKIARRTGEVKYYARMLIEDEPGAFQVNISDLSPEDIRYMATHEREMALLGLRYFLVEGNLYFKATDLVTKESLMADASASAPDNILADLKKSGKKEAVA